MQTNFTAEQLADSDVRESESILRRCVHCGFCTATCPTFLELGDELDSPRGRIYLIKNMLEEGAPATEQEVKHIDRCLSCLSCMSTCPSDVYYMHLVDHARAHIERTYTRPAADRALRNMLAAILPYPRRFRLALVSGRLGRPFAAVMPKRLRAMMKLMPSRLPSPSHLDRAQVIPAVGERTRRVALLTGCAQSVLAPEINEATVRLLTRHGCEVIIAEGMGCCGALTHHMGKTEDSHASARANIAAWWREVEGEGLDAVVINTSGCGTTVKDYGFMLRDEPEWAEKAKHIASITRDVSELMREIGLKAPEIETDFSVTYHSACSLQHGQQVREEPKALLREAGFSVRDVPEGHICCGSAGTYNLLQPELAERLRKRKIANIETTAPDILAAGNIGCMTQIAGGLDAPVVHTVELLDWATGGPKPHALAEIDDGRVRHRIHKMGEDRPGGGP